MHRCGQTSGAASCPQPHVSTGGLWNIPAALWDSGESPCAFKVSSLRNQSQFVQGIILRLFLNTHLIQRASSQ